MNNFISQMYCHQCMIFNVGSLSDYPCVKGPPTAQEEYVYVSRPKPP